MRTFSHDCETYAISPLRRDFLARAAAAAYLYVYFCGVENEPKPKIVRPQAGGQEAFVRSNVDVCFFGGTLGGGKSFGAILCNAEPSIDSQYRAVFFRRTLGELKTAGGIVDDFGEAYGKAVTITKSENPRITFRNTGAWIECRQIADENPNKVRETYKGLQADALFFEELTGYTFYTFNYLRSRCRGKAKWSGKVRATTNPSKKHWVRKWLDWYIGPDGFVIPERSGVVRYFYLADDAVSVDGLIWGDTKEEVYKKAKFQIDKKLAKLGDSVTYENLIQSFTFILGNLAENKALLANNPNYMGSVSGREGGALLEGNWNVDLDDLDEMPISTARAKNVVNNDCQSNNTRYVIADLADTGDDNCVIVCMDGLHVCDIDIIPHSTPKMNCERIRRMAVKWHVADSHILYDAQRAAYVLDYIPEAEGIYSFGKPRGLYRRDFVRLKDEYYFRLAECINSGKISFSEDVWNAPYTHKGLDGLTVGQEFCDECYVVRFNEDSWGRKQLPQKKEMNAILGRNRSMDLLDTIGMGLINYLQYEYGAELVGSRGEASEEYDEGGDVDIFDESTWC